MNVIRMGNNKVRPVRGRGRGKGRDSLYWKPGIDKLITNHSFGQPKYQSSVSESSRGLFNNTQPSSSVVRTPSTNRRIPGIPTSSSKIRSSASTNPQQTSSSDLLDSTVVMAITTGRGDARCEVGMAAIDVKFPHLIISQISDTQTYTNTMTKIHLFNPVEILMPDTICGEDDPRKTLYNDIKLRFKDIQITPVGRMHFNEENGLDRIKMHCSTEFSRIELFVKEKYYALATTAALLKYVEQIQRIIYEPKSMKIEFQASQGSTMIDVESAINLELVSSQGPQRSHNLFSSLDRCVTPMGRRLLRSSLLQPLCNRDAILERQTCISELVHNRNLHTLLQPIIKQLFGADRMLGLSMRTTVTKDTIESAERNLNYILLLKTCLDVIPQLADALDKAMSPKFVKIRENLKDPRFENMKEQILHIVQSDAKSVNGYTSANMQRCFALKSGINDMLDVARQTYCELMEQTTILVDSLAQEYHLPLTIACNASLGYHIQMQMPKQPNFKISDLPCIFIEVQKKRNILNMTTYLLMSLSQQCKEARNDLHIMSSCILETLINNLRNQIGCLFQLSEDIAELDLVMSLARISSIPDFVKPKFAENLRIIESKHPIVDLLANQLPRPNNIEASMAYNFCNITGPNMSGKSTYLKQIVLLQIMAQIGCYLPAREATLRIADRIFCRLCPTYEDIESNASSFIQEIREVEYILQFITPTSLVVLDEICRSTNGEEGAPLAFAICESLLQSTAFVFNCTHYINLTKLTELYHNAVNYYFVCEPNELDKWGLKYTYKLRKGITNVENYGISAASASRLPKSIVDNAKKIVTEIAPHFKPVPLVRAPKLSWEKDCYDCIAKFVDLIISDEFTLENVQKIIEPLRGNRNLKMTKNNDLLYSVLEKNFQKEAPNYQNIVDKSQIVSNAGNSKIIQCNPDYLNNIIVSETETLNIHHQKFQQMDDNFSFKIPASPLIIKNKRSDNKINQRNSIQNSDIEICTKGKINNKFKYIDKSLDCRRNRTLHEFGFSKKKMDNKCTSHLQKSPNYDETTNNSFKSQLSDVSNLEIEKNFSNLSSYSSDMTNISNLHTPKNWLQGEIVSANNSLKRIRQFDDDDCGSPSRKNGHYFKNSRNYQDEIETEFSNISSDQQETTSRSNNNLKENNCQFDNDISNTTKSQVPSLSIFSPRSSIQNNEILSEKNWYPDNNDNISLRSQSRKTSFSTFTPNQSLMERQSVNDENFTSFEMDSHNDFHEKKQQSSDSYNSPKPSISNFTPTKISLESENYNWQFNNNSQSNQDNFSRRSKSQTPSILDYNNSPSHSSLQKQNLTNFSPCRISLENQESQNSFFGGSYHSIESVSRSYLSPSYSPLKISQREKIDNFSQTKDEKNISKSCWNLNELKKNSNTLSERLSISHNSSQCEIKSQSSPFEIKSNNSKNSPLWKTKCSHIENKSNTSRHSFQDEMETQKKLLSQKWQFIDNEENCTNNGNNHRIVELNNSKSLGLNLFKFPTNQIQIKKPPMFESLDYFKRKLSPSSQLSINNFSQKSSISTEIESEGLLLKKPKYNNNMENFQINSIISDSTDVNSLSSFNTENLSHSLILTPKKSQIFFNIKKNSPKPCESQSNKSSSQNQISSLAAKNSQKSLFDSQYKSLSQNQIFSQKNSPKPCESQSYKLSNQKQISSLAVKNSQKSLFDSQYKSASQISFLTKKMSPNPYGSHKSSNQNDFSYFDKGNNNLFKKTEDIENFDDDNKISQFESIIDEDTLEFNDISEFPSPKRQETNTSEAYIISSEDSIEASANIRRREDAIFREIEENANDGEMFLQRIFNSPLSMEYSEELCSCSYSSTDK